MSARFRVPAWSMTVGSMLSSQLGAAVSVSLFASLGTAGTAWVRLMISGAAVIVLARPKYWEWSFKELRAPLALGVVTGLMMLSFMAAISLIPLGTAMAIQFLGPLTVAALHSPSRRAVLWPLLALLGILLLAQPWNESPNLLGMALAAFGAVCWGLYIVITQHVGDRFEGVDGLAISIPAAALIATFFGLPQAWGNFSWDVVWIAVVSAALFPFIPLVLELFALRRLNQMAFGTLMALEPAFALIIGVLLLGQEANLLQYAGIVCVVIAGIAAARTGDRGAVIEKLPSPLG